MTALQPATLEAVARFAAARPLGAPTEHYLLAEQLRANVARLQTGLHIRQALYGIAADALEAIDRMDRLHDARRFVPAGGE